MNEMFKVFKEMHFCYAHRLLGYPGKCAQLHGHNSIVRVEFSGNKLDEQGILIDFDKIRSLVNSFLDEQLDHKTILWEKDPLVEVLQKAEQKVFAMKAQPSAENMAKLIYDYIKENELPVSSVKVWETPTSCAEYVED